MNKKWQLIIIFFLLLSVIPIGLNCGGSEYDDILYVDDDNVEGPWDGSVDHPFRSIQIAIDVATEDATIIVMSGIYKEHLIIDSPLSLQGENMNSTIIDGNNTSGHVITVNADGTTISGFTIQHSGDTIGDSGIMITSNNNIIKNNFLTENGQRRYHFNQGGIRLMECSYNLIEHNLISENRETGIYLYFATNNTIQHNNIYGNYLAIVSNRSSYNSIIYNEIYENYCGMTYWPYSSYNDISYNHVHDHPGCGIALKMYSDHNHISHNTLINNLEWGIMLGFGPTKHTTVEYNTIQGTTGGQQNWFDGSGLVVSIGFFNTIRYNNFIENSNDVYLENSLFNTWDYNFWDSHVGSGPMIIRGHFAHLYTYHPETTIPWFALDLHPADEPYSIQ